jgi:hypothetical protein
MATNPEVHSSFLTSSLEEQPVCAVQNFMASDGISKSLKREVSRHPKFTNRLGINNLLMLTGWY